MCPIYRPLSKAFFPVTLMVFKRSVIRNHHSVDVHVAILCFHLNPTSAMIPITLEVELSLQLGVLPIMRMEALNGTINVMHALNELLRYAPHMTKY